MMPKTLDTPGRDTRTGPSSRYWLLLVTCLAASLLFGCEGLVDRVMQGDGGVDLDGPEYAEKYIKGKLNIVFYEDSWNDDSAMDTHVADMLLKGTLRNTGKRDVRRAVVEIVSRMQGETEDHVETMKVGPIKAGGELQVEEHYDGLVGEEVEDDAGNVTINFDMKWNTRVIDVRFAKRSSDD